MAGCWGYLVVQKLESLTLAGSVYAASGLQSLQDGDPESAVGSLRLARRQFLQARNLLGPEWLRDVPWLGRQLDAVDDLCTVGVESSAAGVELAALLQKSASVSGQGRLNRLIQLAHAHLPAALASLATLADVNDRLEPDGLIPQLSDVVTATKGALVRAQPWLGRSRALVGLERHLFSRQHRFLVITQDSAELRPTGGSIETFGLIELGPKGFTLTKSADIDSLPNDTLDLPLPSGKVGDDQHFRFRDANWWLDFPTSASQMLQLWEDTRQPDIDGIVAVDIPMIQSLLDVYGPLELPESKVPLTADNVIDELTRLAQSKPSGASNGAWEHPVVSLTNELVDRVTDMTGEQVLPTLESMIGATNEKHMQIYLLDARAQADMLAVGWSGALEPPEGTTDLVGVSNSVVERGKANLGIAKTLDYRVKVATDGSATTKLTLGYRMHRHKLPGVAKQSLANYVRANRSPGTEQEQASTDRFKPVPDRTGLPTFGQYFRLDRGSTQAVLHTTVPQASREVAPEATSAVSGRSWRYRLLVAKQGDLVETDVTASVTVPVGWRVTGSAAWFRVTGQKVATSAKGTTVTLSVPLKEDLVLDVTLSPA